jgi:hypothetical protein
MTSAVLRPALPLVVAAALGASGCLSPYLKRAADVPEPKPSPALVSGFVVHFDSSEEKSLVGAAIDAAQNAGLDEFGKKATDLLAAALAERGYTAAWDGPRTAKLDVIQIASNSGSAALTGQWRHPESSHWVPQAVDSLFVKPADVIAKIRGEEEKEYFAFADILIRDNGIILKEPWVVVRAVVYDQDARKVLDLQGVGSGESQVFLADRSPKNLEVALTRGFESLKAVQEEAL